MKLNELPENELPNNESLGTESRGTESRSTESLSTESRKEVKDQFLEALRADIELDLARGTYENIRKYASDTDEYVRKNTYLVLGKIYSTHFHLKDQVYFAVDKLLKDANSQIRHTAVLAFGELMKLEPKRAIELLTKVRPQDILWLPKEAIEIARRMGRKIMK